MRTPSDAQAALLACVQSHEERGEYVLRSLNEHGFSRAALVVERDDHGPLHGVQMFVAIDPSLSALVEADLPAPREVTVGACVRYGWLRADHEVTVRSQRFGVCWTMGPEDYTLRQLDLTEDGTIALGLWRQRKLAAGPPPLPTLTDREREVVDLAQRARELGYALCATEPARPEARQMRRAGWFDYCWVANNAHGLVPSPMALVEVRPDLADVA